jgi:hypothetical protein
MTLFVVLSRTVNPTLASAIEAQFPGELSHKYNDNTWVISATGTAKEICDLLGIKKGGIVGTVVFPTTNSYYGVNPTIFWDWLKARVEEGGNG